MAIHTRCKTLSEYIYIDVINVLSAPSTISSPNMPHAKATYIYIYVYVVISKTDS